MNKILQLDHLQKDLWLSYTWSRNNHGICGHLYEVLDYYLFLKDKLKVGILFGEPLSWKSIEEAIRDKYDLSEDEIVDIKNNTVLANKPMVVKGSNILFTNGGVTALKDVVLLFNKVIHFACGDLNIKDNVSEKVFVLQDERIYSKCFNSINYVKKINFAKYKKNIVTENNDNLIYATKSCRDLSLDSYLEIEKRFSGNFLCLTNSDNRPSGLSSRFYFMEMPVRDLFTRFETYIYTPIKRKFDCSPRLIAECLFYGKKVEYFNIDYLEEDKGLYWRKFDIENNFAKIHLNEDDEILKILRQIL